MPIFVASLKDPVSVATLETLFTQAPPSVILNCTSFAVGSPTQATRPLKTPSPPPSPTTPPSSRSSSPALPNPVGEGLHGLSARDIAMNVALPEVDGRILSRAVSFKGEAYFDEATECPSPPTALWATASNLSPN